MRKNKYNAVKTVVDGITFDSKAEANRYRELQVAQRAGEVRWFTRQPSFILPGNIRYRPDFLVMDKHWRMHVEDVKGFETPAFKLKKKLWGSTFPGLPLWIIR